MMTYPLSGKSKDDIIFLIDSVKSSDGVLLMYRLTPGKAGGHYGRNFVIISTKM